MVDVSTASSIETEDGSRQQDDSRKKESSLMTGTVLPRERLIIDVATSFDTHQHFVLQSAAVRRRRPSHVLTPSFYPSEAHALLLPAIFPDKFKSKFPLATAVVVGGVVVVSVP